MLYAPAPTVRLKDTVRKVGEVEAVLTALEPIQRNLNWDDVDEHIQSNRPAIIAPRGRNGVIGHQDDDDVLRHCGEEYICGDGYVVAVKLAGDVKGCLRDRLRSIAKYQYYPLKRYSKHGGVRILFSGRIGSN